jgi:hypothetical protein
MSDNKDDRPIVATPRLPYEKPSVIAEEVFETLALSCAKATIATPGCRLTDSRS